MSDVAFRSSAPWRHQFDNARDPYAARNALGITSLASGAPINVEYITASADATLTNERVLTDTASITWDFSTPGQAKANTAGGGGNVSNVGTPVSGQFARWTTATTIEGISPAATLTAIGAQPLDADLTAIAALTGTNVIYYRSAADTWAPVNVSTGLSFTGGNLTATAGAGPFQPQDATLTALAAFNTNGLLTQTAADTFTGRTITGPAAGITVSNGNGVAGDPTLALANDLAALEGLSGTNTIYYRSGTDAWSGVTIGTGLSFASGILSTSSSGAGTITMPQGRLTLQTGVPVMTTTQAAKTTIYYTPYRGNSCPIYDGSNFTMTAFSEISVATTDTSKNPAAIGASKVNDWFVWNDSGTLRISHGPDWTNSTTRSAGTALTLVNGIWLNNVAITNGPAAQRGTYIGTTFSNSTSTLDWKFGTIASLGGAAVLGVWNCYNRVAVATAVGDTTSTWSYSGGIRAANNSGNMNVVAVFGQQEDVITAEYHGISNCVAGSNAIIGIGLDTAFAFALAGAAYTTSQPASVWTKNVARYDSMQLGAHSWYALESSASGAAVQFGGQNSNIWQNSLFLYAMM